MPQLDLTLEQSQAFQAWAEFLLFDIRRVFGFTSEQVADTGFDLSRAASELYSSVTVANEDEAYRGWMSIVKRIAVRALVAQGVSVPGKSQSQAAEMAIANAIAAGEFDGFRLQRSNAISGPLQFRLGTGALLEGWKESGQFGWLF